MIVPLPDDVSTLLKPILVAHLSAPAIPDLMYLGATLFDVMRYGLSPIVLDADKGWLPIIEIACKKEGYEFLRCNNRYVLTKGAT